MKSLKSETASGRMGIAQTSPASPVLQAQAELMFPTGGQGLYEVTGEINSWLEAQRLSGGLLTLFLKHTSASLVIQENIDPDVLHDLHTFFQRLVPEDGLSYRHDAEGPDDMPAHIRAALTQTHLSIPVEGSRMALGRYQGVFIYEHRTGRTDRKVAAHWLATRGSADPSAERTTSSFSGPSPCAVACRSL